MLCNSPADLHLKLVSFLKTDSIMLALQDAKLQVLKLQQSSFCPERPTNPAYAIAQADRIS